MHDDIAKLADLHSVMRGLHFFSFSVAVGTAVLMDIIVVRMLFFGVKKESVTFLGIGHRVVLLALLCVIGSGAVLVLIGPDHLLSTAKLQAKIAIFAVLTLNGIAIHRWCVPFIERRVARTVLSGTNPFQRAGLGVSGAVSASSWIFILGLSAMTSAHQMQLESMLVVYTVMLTIAFAATLALLEYAFRTTGYRMNWPKF